MNKTLVITISLVLSLVGAPAFADDTLVVGSSRDAEFSTIQAAVDAAQAGDFISVEDGTYTESVDIVSGKDLTISGNVFDNSAVVLEGKILVRDGATAQIDYITVSATGESYGIKILGIGIVQYGVVDGGVDGIIIGQDGAADIYEETVQQADRHGIVLKPTASADISTVILKHNARNGLRVNTHKAFTLGDSVLSYNGIGVVLNDTANGHSTILRNTFKHNTVGLKSISSNIYRADNRFSDNDDNIITE